MTLTEFMEALRDEGVVGEEFEERVAEFVERRREGRGQIVRQGSPSGDMVEQARETGMIPFPTSAQDRGIRTNRARIPVDYGDESPAEAEARWREQEMNDPQGVYSAGGMSGGGIFGAGPVAVDDYDPGAHQRGVPVITAQVQVKQLEVLERMERRLAESEEENRQLRAREENRQLEGSSGRRRRLGGKKR